jgi:hypothetical protein
MAAIPDVLPGVSRDGVARRDLFVDTQSNYALPKPKTYYRWRSMASDASMLGSISQPQIQFNPVFQTVVLHEASVTRAVKKIDRLAEARFELIRREQRLEQLVINRAETLLVVLNDVRVGDIVEVSYTVEGENPIYGGRLSTGVGLVSDASIDVLHYRITVSKNRVLNYKALTSDVKPEKMSEGPNQVLRIALKQVPAVNSEQGTPLWFKVYPAFFVSDYGSWVEVDRWAQGLFSVSSVDKVAFTQRFVQRACRVRHWPLRCCVSCKTTYATSVPALARVRTVPSRLKKR